MANVTFFAPRSLDKTIGFQKYYLLGLAERARLRLRGSPILSLAPGVRPAVAAAYRLSKSPLRPVLDIGRGSRPSAGHDGLVGCYEFEHAGTRTRVALDSHDAKDVRNPAALEWCDLYFKSNRWPQEPYDERVRPLVNGNGTLDHERIRFLRSLRTAPKDLDVVLIANIWGGREHLVRVYEALAQVECSKLLVANFVRGYEEAETRELEQRLQAVGVTTRREYLPQRELWRELARARILFLRPGKHLCISWRMLDPLAMGAAILYDALPPPRWPQPLERGVHYEECGIDRPLDTGPAPAEDYEKIPSTVEALLADPDRLRTLRAGAADYFDRHAAPERVADYLLDEVRKHAEG
ncbi:MAG: hypothetical protein QOH73_482 [Gaiellaceae bacterium]|nr:hypothetical protein [Gaiellaceae bacterium]